MIKDIEIGDMVLTTNKDSMTGKKVESEVVKITEVYSCGTYFKGVYITDGDPCILFDDEILRKVPKLELIK